MPRCRVDHRCDGVDADGNGYVETDPSGRYGRFDDVLGRGAMKTVYRAFDEFNGKEVAWYQAKVTDVLRSPEALERLYSEVNLLRSFNHESIIRYQESWIDTENRTFNFITEMFTSGTLREYRQKYRRVDIRAIKSWARQILHGLVYLHSHDPPVIHRDIKCDNIFVNGHLGQVKIGDLGLAAVLRGCQSAHSVIGTPEFMAPELYEEDYNELVDIYSFGMCVLEMLTSEYPYNECTNPAQIYRKVTMGKLPDSFHQLQHAEAKRFIGRCLEKAWKRPSAKELLQDPFLALDDHQSHSLTRRTPCNPEVKDIETRRHHRLNFHADPSPTVRSANMTITGKMNHEDDAIILKVQIVDKDGQVRNIYFPFDIVGDTAKDVAYEMVKELEITDREPSEIAEMIAQEISMLVPGWKEGSAGQDVYSYEEDEGDGSNHPFCYFSSPNSSQGSIYGTGHPPGTSVLHCGGHHIHEEHNRDHGQFNEDEDSSSLHSDVYSTVNYTSGNEHEREKSSGGHQREAQPSTSSSSSSHGPTRFGSDEAIACDYDQILANAFQKQCKNFAEPSHASCSSSAVKKPAQQNRHLLRNRSMVDMRSQLLHRTLVEELNKRMIKTVGSVENIGFQMPYDCSSKSSSSSAAAAAASSSSSSDRQRRRLKHGQGNGGGKMP